MTAHNGNTPGDAWSWANWAAGKEQPAAAATPTTPANPPGTGINSTGQSASNKALLDSLGFTQPNLTPTDLTTLGGQGAASIQDVLNSPTYRQLAGQYTSTGSTPYSAVPEVQQYEQKLQTLNNPSAMNPAFWDSLGTDGQQAWLGAAQQIFGWDPTEYVRQINATRPLGSPFAPQSVQTRFAPVGA